MESEEKDRKRKTEVKNPDRRKFLKQVLPGGWIPEAIISGGVDHLSKEAKVSLAKDVALASLALGGILAADKIGEKKTEKSLKKKVLSFAWKDAEDKEKLRAFVEQLADGYLQTTQTRRLTKEDLIGENRITFYQTKDAFTQGVRVVAPNYQPTETQWGYTHYSSKRVFIDLESIKKQALTQNADAGLALINALWHEWGHLDVVERTEGELINNPSKAYLNSPNSKKREPYSRYRGGAVYTETYYGFLRFEEALNETITVRRMIEQVGLEKVVSGRDYYENGVDFFPRLTYAIGISLEDLYQMHATSDFEGLAKRIGEKLPGKADSLAKGGALFVGIHNSDPKIIQQTGALDIAK